MRIWSKAFWKDAAERVVATFIAVLVGVFSAEGFSTDSLDEWRFWAPILITTAITVVKALGFGAINPNTGASAGTAIPGGIVQAYTAQTKTESTTSGGRHLGYVAHPGDTVAGPAAASQTDLQEGEPVYVKPVPQEDTRPPVA
jgi:hypothetical protein